MGEQISTALETLMEAAQDGDALRVKALIEQNPELLEARKENGQSPLMVALYYDMREVADLLLRAGAPLNIHEAAALDDAETLRELLEEEPRLLMLESYDGWTPLHLAALFGAYHTAELLIAAGADVNVRSYNKVKSMPIHAATAGRRYALVQLLLQNGADANAAQGDGRTPLHQAAAHADPDLCRLLLEHGARVDAAQADGTTPLDVARDKNYDEVERLLREWESR